MKIKFGDNSLNLKVDGSLANIDRGPRGYSAYEIAVQEGFAGTEEEWLASLVGPEGKQGKDGERGIQGPRGQQGDKGDRGDTGPQGEKGDRGDTGPQGDKGDIGPQGEKGDTGPSNVLSIGSVTKGDEANATITGESPNQILNLVLPKGDKGDKGDKGEKGDTGPQGETGATGNGILSIQKTATAGLVDTYTTTFTNGTTTTFDVTNGEDGEVTQKQLDETNENVSWLQTLTDQMPHVAGQGTDLSLESVLNYRLMKFLPQGVSSQESMTGKNLFHILDWSGTTVPKTGISSTVLEKISNNEIVLTATGTWSNALIDFGENFFNTNQDIIVGADFLENISERISKIRLQLYGSTDGSSYTTISKTEDTDIAYNVKQHLSVLANTGSYTYIRLRIWNNATATSVARGNSVINVSNIMVALGTDDTYEPYTGGIPAPNTSYSIMPSRVTGENSLVICNENLFNKNSITPNSYLDSDGNIITNTTWSISDYIPVIAGEDYVYRWLTAVGNAPMSCYYDENKNFVSSFKQTTNGTKITIPSNVKFVRFTIETKNTDDLNTFMFIKGSTAPTTYVEHEEQNYLITLKSDNLIGLGTAQYPVDLKVGDKITLTSQLENTTLQLNLYTNFGDSERNDYWSIQPGQSRTITVAKDSKAIAWNRLFSGLAWVNKGETSLSYKPYIANPIELNSSPDGTIRDGIVGKPNEWCKREYIGKVVFDGVNNAFSTKSSTTANQLYISNEIGNMIVPNNNNVLGKGLSSHFKIKTAQNIYANDLIGFGIRTDNKISFGFGASSDLTTLALANQWLQTQYNNGTPVTTYYLHVNYVDIPITDTTLINQLNDIYNNAHSYNGVTNITTTYEDGNEQMYLDIEALAKGGSTTTETDPIFSASASSGITSSDISNWNNKADVEDIPDLTDYVKNTDYASSSKGGVFRSSSAYKTVVDPIGTLRTSTVAFTDYGNLNNSAFIGKGTLENVITGKNLADKNYVDTAIATAITNTLGGSY